VQLKVEVLVRAMLSASASTGVAGLTDSQVVVATNPRAEVALVVAPDIGKVTAVFDFGSRPSCVLSWPRTVLTFLLAKGCPPLPPQRAKAVTEMTTSTPVKNLFFILSLA
jgi:hypothetical protein